jgi:hypothetical protein
MLGHGERRVAPRRSLPGLPRLALLLCAGILGGTPEPSASAAVTPNRSQTVVLMVDPAAVDPLVARIEAELLSVGLAVRRIDISPGVDIETVVSKAMASGASAALRIIPRSKGTEVWTNDTRARVLRRHAINLEAPDAALSVLAFRSVEFLRASLLDIPKSVLRQSAEAARPAAEARPPLATAAPVPAAPVAAPPPAAFDDRDRPPAVVAPPTEPTIVTTKMKSSPVSSLSSSPAFARAASAFAAMVGPAWWLGSRRLPALPTLAVAIRYRVTRAVALGPEALVPLSTQTLTAAEGSSAIRLVWLGLSAQGTLPVSARLDLRSRASVGAIQLRAVGTDLIHGLGRSDVTWDVAAGASVGAALALTPSLAVRLDVGGGIASKRIILSYANRDVATWGPAFAVAGVALEASF